MKMRIEQDSDVESPKDMHDESLFLVADHRDFFVPPGKDWRFDVQSVIDEHKKTHWVFLLEAYIHSGVVLALAGEGNFVNAGGRVRRQGRMAVEEVGSQGCREPDKRMEPVPKWGCLGLRH